MLQNDKVAATLEKVKATGGRLTRIRRALIEILAGSPLPLPSSAILKRLKQMGLRPHRTTVYRELFFLVKNEITQKVRLSGENYFEISFKHHHHLICSKCKSIEEVVLGPHLELQEHRIYQKQGFKVTHHSLEFYGLCKNCRAGLSNGESRLMAAQTRDSQ